MILVDAVVWSLAFRRRIDVLSPPQLAVREHLVDAIASGDARLISAVRQQVLTGIRPATKFAAIRDDLEGVESLAVTDRTHVLAAEYANRCIDRGIAADPIDMLLCAASFEYAVPIWTLDGDFQRYATACPIPPLYVIPPRAD